MKRILTALVALPILIYSIWSPIPYFFTAIAVISAVVALNEFYGLTHKNGFRAYQIPGYIAALLTAYCFMTEGPAWIVAVFAGLVISALSIAACDADRFDKSLPAVSATVFGVLYTAVLAGFLIGVKMMPDSASTVRAAPKLLTMFFAMVMMTDTGAYYTGRALGRHKLAPRLSPGKTVEGSIGGFIAAIAAGLVCRVVFFPEIPAVQAALVGAAIGIFAQIGDLAESMLKRSAGVKDSGRVFPGHGGMLDRVDSILFCAPLLYYYSKLFVPSW